MAQFPKSFLVTSREEYDGRDKLHKPLQLNIKCINKDSLKNLNIDRSSIEFLESEYWIEHTNNDEISDGPLPDDLVGHIFWIAPIGTFDSKKAEGTHQDIRLPAADGTTFIYYGDGLIYRLDLHRSPQSDCDSNNSIKGAESKDIFERGWARLASKIVKTPDYYVDAALRDDGKYNPETGSQAWPAEEYNQSKFFDSGLTRTSPSLGGRHFVNTAFVALKPISKNEERLLVTWDAGRPYEINPRTLEIISPVGTNEDWKPLIELNSISRSINQIPGLSGLFPILTQVFPIVMSHAHPQYDRTKEVLYIANVTKSIITNFPINRMRKQIIRSLVRSIDIFDIPEYTKLIVQGLVRIISFILLEAANLLLSLLKLLRIGGSDHLYLYRWDGTQTKINDDDKWEIVDNKGKPISITQTIHQMALTKEFIIISNSSVKTPPANMLPAYLDQPMLIFLYDLFSRFSLRPLIGLPDIGEPNFYVEYAKFILFYFNYPQEPYTEVYIIPHPDTVDEDINRTNKIAKIRSKRIRISPETAHFFTNYLSNRGEVILHAAHIPASDTAEFIKERDRAVCNFKQGKFGVESVICADISKTDEMLERVGMVAPSLDACNLRSWLLDLSKNNIRVIDSDIELGENLDLSWGASIYAYDEDAIGEELNIYWNTVGIWPNSLSNYTFELYKDRPRQNVDLETYYQALSNGKRSSLIHVIQKVDPDSKKQKRVTLNLVDYYQLPQGFVANSPHFIPSNGSSNKSNKGYVLCIVVATDNSLTTESGTKKKFCEIWIFNSLKISNGPIYRLSHPNMNIGATVHSTWLKELKSPSSSIEYNIRDDFEDFLSRVSPNEYQDRVRKLFEDDVYDNFPILSNE